MHEFQQLTGDTLYSIINSYRKKARLDICARGFWQIGCIAFFDVKVLNPNAKRYLNEEISKTCELNEKEKRSLYHKRNIEIEHGNFTPLLMTGTTRMVKNAARFTRA